MFNHFLKCILRNIWKAATCDIQERMLRKVKCRKEMPCQNFQMNKSQQHTLISQRVKK